MYIELEPLDSPAEEEEEEEDDENVPRAEGGKGERLVVATLVVAIGHQGCDNKYVFIYTCSVRCSPVTMVMIEVFM